MSDLISRQVAIELIHTMYPSAQIMRMNRKKWKKKYKPYIESEKALERLPSAQPQYEEITPEEAASEIASGIVRITGGRQKRKTKAKDCRGIGSLFVVILNLV